MALVLKDRVKETTTTTGTGTLTLLGAATGYQAFSAIGNGNTCYYAISAVGSSEWEVGIGTYTASGTTLSRDTILSSSNAGSVVTLSAGTKDVYVVYPSEKAVNLNSSDNVSALGTITSGIWQGTAISDTYLSTISTAGKVSNSATTATSTNGASTIVARDASGNFSANTVTASLTGTASNATVLQTARNFQISGGATASNVSFDGSSAVNLSVTAMNASVINAGTIGNAYTTAASANGASTIVARDASGNFSANTITANVTGSISGSAASLTNAQNFQISGGATAANVSFNGTAAVNLNVTAMNASVINTGTIGNAYTTASSSNGASTIVARDASGNFSAATITATTFSGAHSGDGSALTNLNATAISSGTLANARTTATDANGASTIVARDASGNFTGNTITAVTGFSGPGGSLTALNATALSQGTVATGRISGSYTGITGVGTLTAGTWNATAISDTYLSTISTAGKVSNSATTASSSNGASTIIARDASGNFTANNITANGDVTSSSDERLKADWVSVVYDFVDKLAQVKSGVYKRIDSGATQVGVSAQSLAQVLPQATSFDENGNMTVAYGQAALVAAIELAKQIVELKKEIDLLKAK